MICLIREKVRSLYQREKPEIHKEILKDEYGIGRRLVKYWKCDYCGEKIKIDDVARTGGITKLSHVITGSRSIQVALCNKCVNPVLREFEEGRSVYNANNK